jgi:hypothetical protein
MEFYPDSSKFYNSDDLLFQIQSITYNVMFNFLPYDLKITETLTPEWGQENVIGRMDSIATFKRMTRTMNATFKARARQGDLQSTEPQKPHLPLDDLLHTIDHIKKTLYPRYNSQQILTSPPLFRIKYANLILAGEDTDEAGVLCYINSFSANPVMETNKVSYRLLSSNTGSAGGPTANLAVGAYPNIFDVSIGFTILNENLAQQQVEGILNKRYFYNYQTSNGPDGGHPFIDAVEAPLTAEQQAEMDKDEEQRAAVEAAALAGAK